MSMLRRKPAPPSRPLRSRALLRPDNGQRVQMLVCDTQEQLVAVVDDLASGFELLVREPVDADGCPVAGVVPGAELVLTWTTASGRHDLDVTLAAEVPDRLPLWRLEVAAEPRTMQRRRFARAPDALRAQVRSHTTMWPAIVTDLSEGGARCTGSVPGTDLGDEVLLALTLDGTEFQLPARVLDTTPERGGSCVVRLEFGDLGEAADLLRRRVFVQQQRSRGA